jgi:antitoxin ParD1/3/4
MHVSLTPRLEEYAKEKVSSGLYNNASELVREALRLMIQREQDYDRLKIAVSRGFEQIEGGELTRVKNEEEFLAMARGRRSDS